MESKEPKISLQLKYLSKIFKVRANQQIMQ